MLQLQASLEEKNEAVQCLKALLTDNEALTTCLRDQQQSLNFQRKENEELMKKLNESLGKYCPSFYKRLQTGPFPVIKFRLFF